MKMLMVRVIVDRKARSRMLNRLLVLVISDSELVIRQNVLLKIGKKHMLMYGGEH